MGTEQQFLEAEFRIAHLSILYQHLRRRYILFPSWQAQLEGDELTAWSGGFQTLAGSPGASGVNEALLFGCRRFEGGRCELQISSFN